MLQKLWRKYWGLIAVLLIVAPTAVAQLGPGGTTYGSAVITGGSINNTPIGQTTPAAVAATVLTSNSSSVTGTLTVGGQSLFANGTNLAPSISFASSPTFGIYKYNANILAIAGNSAITGLMGGGFYVPSSGVYAFSASANADGGADTILLRDAAGTLALRNGVNPQTFRVYNTYTDASNNEYGQFSWGGNSLNIGTVKNGTGASRNINFQIGGSTIWTMDASGNFYGASPGSGNIGNANPLFLVNSYYIRPQPRTVAVLVTCASGTDGYIAFVTDSTLSYTGTNLGSPVTGGGTNHVPVYCDGSGTPAWKIGG